MTRAGVLSFRATWSLARPGGIIPGMIPTPTFAMPSAAPAPSSRAARRDADRQRKRDERQALRDRGAPDPRQLDAAIVDALRDAILAPSGEARAMLRYVEVKAVIKGARERLRGRANGGVALRQAAIYEALGERLMGSRPAPSQTTPHAPPSRRPAPAQLRTAPLFTGDPVASEEA